MGEIRRFDTKSAFTHEYTMFEHEEGVYVFYADHLTALAELTKERDGLRRALEKYKGVRDGFGRVSANLVLGLQCEHEFMCHGGFQSSDGCLHDNEGKLGHICIHCGLTVAALGRQDEPAGA